MKKYLLKRIVYLILVFFVVSVMMYAIYNLIPSDPALVQMEPLRKQLKPDEWQRQYQDLRQKLGLNDPLLTRYARWMGVVKDVDGTFNGMLQGNFGYSISYKRDVVDIIGTPMLNTILLNLFSTILTLAITIPLGIYCAVHARSAGDSAIQATTVVGYSLPTYLVGILFIYIFAVLLRWFPTGGAKTPGSTYVGMKELLDRLNHVLTSDFGHVTYTEAIKLLEPHNDRFEYPVHWGSDLQTEHERYLTEELFKRPVFVTDYPKEIKAFYMKLNPDGKTVAAMDCLVPGIGEIIGGSQREDDYELLLKRMNELGLKPEDYGFYLDLRKYGSARHAGFGLGFERCVMYLTGMANIRDVIPFPRTVNNCDL